MHQCTLSPDDRGILLYGHDADSHHIVWKFPPREVFHVLVVCVNDLSQLASVNHLFKNPHVNDIVKLWILCCISSHNFGDGGAPGKRRGSEEHNVSDLTEDADGPPTHSCDYINALSHTKM